MKKQDFTISIENIDNDLGEEGEDDLRRQLRSSKKGQLAIRKNVNV